MSWPNIISVLLLLLLEILACLRQQFNPASFACLTAYVPQCGKTPAASQRWLLLVLFDCPTIYI